jgi:hypothetical protein
MQKNHNLALAFALCLFLHFELCLDNNSLTTRVLTRNFVGGRISLSKSAKEP